MTGSKSVTIKIDPKDLKTLKDSQYKLCFAKRVGDHFNVVWQSYHDYLEENTFSWTPVYQIFGANEFQGGVRVQASTAVKNITLGEEVTMSSEGVLSKPSTASPPHPNSLTFKDEYGTIHPGVSQLSTGLKGQSSSTPIYVASHPIVNGVDTLTPKEYVQVWFAQNVETSTMISEDVSNATVIDLTGTPTAARTYRDQKWVTPGAGEFEDEEDLAFEPTTLLTILLTTTVVVSAHNLLAKITSRLTGVYQNIDVTVMGGEGRELAIHYSEKPGLSSSDRLFMASLMTATIHEQLTQLTCESLAQCSADLEEMQVAVP